MLTFVYFVTGRICRQTKDYFFEYKPALSNDSGQPWYSLAAQLQVIPELEPISVHHNAIWFILKHELNEAGSDTNSNTSH
jgi:hypothetical protein